MKASVKVHASVQQEKYGLKLPTTHIKQAIRAGSIAVALVAALGLVTGESLLAARHKAEASVGELAADKLANSRLATSDVLARLPLRFEACDRVAGRFLARTGEYGVYVTATEALLMLQAAAGAGRLGRGADLGLPRNAKSLDATTQLPGPLRDRAAPRAQPSTTLRMRLIGANPRARAVGEKQLPMQTNYFTGKDTTKWRVGVHNYARDGLR